MATGAHGKSIGDSGLELRIPGFGGFRANFGRAWARFGRLLGGFYLLEPQRLGGILECRVGIFECRIRGPDFERKVRNGTKRDGKARLKAKTSKPA